MKFLCGLSFGISFYSLLAYWEGPITGQRSRIVRHGERYTFADGANSPSTSIWFIGRIHVSHLSYVLGLHHGRPFHGPGHMVNVDADDGEVPGGQPRRVMACRNITYPS